MFSLHCASSLFAACTKIWSRLQTLTWTTRPISPPSPRPWKWAPACPSPASATVLARKRPRPWPLPAARKLPALRTPRLWPWKVSTSHQNQGGLLRPKAPCMPRALPRPRRKCETLKPEKVSDGTMVELLRCPAVCRMEADLVILSKGQRQSLWFCYALKEAWKEPRFLNVVVARYGGLRCAWLSMQLLLCSKHRVHTILFWIVFFFFLFIA